MTKDWFEQDDCRLIFAATEAVATTVQSADRQECRLAVAAMIRRLLDHFGYWDESVVVGRQLGMFWSSASMVWLFQQHPTSEWVPIVGRRFAEVRARARDADAHLRLCVRSLLGTAELKITPLQFAGDLVKVSRLTGVPIDVLLRSCDASAIAMKGAAA
jgi:hypothetical protein